MQRETEFRGEPIEFVESSDVKEGVTCDIYKFKEDNTKDLGIVEVKKGYRTPLQLVVVGDCTFEVFIQGKGTLMVTNKDGSNRREYDYPDESNTEVKVKIGEKMQWEALEDLVFAEICYPSYKEGRFINVIEDVTIGKGNLAGKGVYANRDFKKDEVVIQYHLKTLTEEEYKQLSESEKMFTHSHWGQIMLYGEPERYVNHSSDSNTYQDLKKQQDIALRDIKKGEMITGDATKDDIE